MGDFVQDSRARTRKVRAGSCGQRELEEPIVWSAFKEDIVVTIPTLPQRNMSS
jgi:hypothetical protein